MNSTKSGSDPPRDFPENTSKNSTTTPLEETDLLSPSRRSKRLQKDDLPESKNSDILLNKESSQTVVENNSTAQIASPSETSCCSKNFHCGFGLYDQEFDSSPSLNHKFYGCKRKAYPSPCSESFALPDDPIFSNSPIFLDRTRKSPLDIDLADPWDISVLDMENVDQPWLVEYPEVITPYWDVESLFPFEVEDIRQKIEPEEDDWSKSRSSSGSFNISSGLLDTSGDNDNVSDSVFTSTPVKTQNNSLSVISTINITNGQDNNVNIAVLKDEVLRALEEAIKKKNTVANIDMKIQIVTSDLTTPATSPKQSSVEVRINENVETSSCRSTSSSKENYFIENAQGDKGTSNSITNAKELSNLILTDLNEDWQDSPVSDVNDQSQDELDSLNEPSSTKKSKNPIKNRKKTVQWVRRSLRSRESNILDTSDKEASTSGNQLGLGENSLSNSTNTGSKTRLPHNELENLSNEVVPQQDPEINSVNKEESELASKRILRSGNQFNDKKNVNLSGFDKNIKEYGIKETQRLEDKRKQRGQLTRELVQLSFNNFEFVDSRLRSRNKFSDEGSQLSQDESDSSDAIDRNRVRRTLRNREIQSSKNNIKNSANKPKINEKTVNSGLQCSEHGINSEQLEGNEPYFSQDEGNTQKSENSANFQSSQNDKGKRRRGRPIKVKLPFSEDTLSSQEESDTDKRKVETNRSKRKGIQNDISQSAQTERIISKNVLEGPKTDMLQLNHSDSNIGNYIGRKLRERKVPPIEDLQSSQDESDVGKNSFTKTKRNKLPGVGELTLLSQDESDISKNNEVERNKKKGRLQNDESHSAQSGSDISKSFIGPNKDAVQPNHSESNNDKYIGKKLRDRKITLKEDVQTSQDESDINKDDVNERKRKGRPRKVKEQKHNDVSSNTSSKSMERINQSVETSEDFTEDEDDMSRFKRILRSSTQHLRQAANQAREGRRRTVSSSVPEKVSNNQNTGFSPRRRTVSANFDNKIDHSTPIRRSLRSQVAELTKLSVDLKSPVSELIKSTPKAAQNIRSQNIRSQNIRSQNIRSQKISFNLTNSFKETPRKFATPIKSILKNVYDSAGRLIGVKVHREKHVKMPSALDIKPEDGDTDNTPSKKRPTHQSFIPTGLELDSIKKEEEECLRENGITSRIKIVISPLEIKQENKDDVDKTCPVLPLAVPKHDVPPLRKSGRSSNVTQEVVTESKSKKNDDKNVSDTTKSVDEKEIKGDKIQETAKDSKTQSIGKSKANEGKSNVGDTAKSAEANEVKSEETDYNLGDLVWAQVGKYPFWPAIVCNDPETNTFQKEVPRQNMASQIHYHIRFFGDYGRRAWVSRKHIMLYCSDHDLDLVANKLKSENKNHNSYKLYSLTGSSVMIDKWHKAVEELNSLKVKKYEDIVRHMLDTFEKHWKNRKKRKVTDRDGSSESESEESGLGEGKRRKKSQCSEHLHITADTELTDNATVQNKGSEGFDEINISIGVQSTAAATEGLDKATPRRSRRSLKPLESYHVTADTLDLVQQAGSVEVSENSEIPNESSVKLGERRSLRIPKISPTNELSSSQSAENEKLGKNQPDERSEAESKSSSDGRSSSSNMYSFEYQMELHKKNSLFNGLSKVKVCDYCLKPGDLYKCKGKCFGFFHLNCASKVTVPRDEKRAKKREKIPNKAKVRNVAPSLESTPKSNRMEEGCRTRNQCQVQIITIKSKHAIGTPKKVNLPANFDELSLSEQIDYGMKEMMSKFENGTLYGDSTDSSSEEGSIIASKNKQLGILDSPSSSVVVDIEKSAAKSSDLEENGEEERSSDDLEVSTISGSARKPTLIKHVTADSVILTEVEAPVDVTNFKCTFCRLEVDPPCFACGLEVSRRGSSTRRKCSQYRCGRYYHPYCLKMWPQSQWSIGKWSRNQEQEDSFTCPAHTCHTCFSEELGSAACRLPGDKLARCMLCPAGFHTTTFCIPAGTDILGGSQIVCPRHRPKPTQPINTIWCFICSEGGNLICCDTCPTSVHPECQPINLMDDDTYICEDCESGRFPLYDEIVWVKLGQYRWWPALVLFPNEIPENVKALKRQRGDFAVRFFGTNDHYWVNKARSFLFQEGDRGGSPGEGTKSKNKVYETFGKAIEDAALAYKLKKQFKLRREAESIDSLKPPTYVKINKNKPIGNVKSLELDLSNATACECDPKKPHPCGPDSNCINRLLMTECDPDVCPAGSRCRNQAFQRREYPPMLPYKTQGRGWGLKCLAPIKKGQFVIEYVGDLIDSEEYQRRIQKMHEQKEENYYFMTVDSDRMIDAGPKGNLSRFMNHCCDPNCVTQKWTVRGDTRVGLFAKCDIESGSELTFNYNLEVVGQEKKVCKCGASNCSGFIGVKAKIDKPEKPQADSVTEPTEQRRPRKYTKKRAVSPPLIPPCFTCGRKQSDLTCNNKFCNKGYHLKCLKLEDMPEVAKFTCPRHNCNICSNRTIRCCVKCTNSFCPSHSEGNVRHDKFMGFVCRLHDPARPSTVLTSPPMREKGKSNFRYNKVPSKKKKSGTKSIYSYPPEKREAVRASWRFYKRREYDKKKMMKLNLNGNIRRNSSEGKKVTEQLRQKSKTGRTRSRASTQQESAETGKIYQPKRRKILSESEIKYYNHRKQGKGIDNLPSKDQDIVRAMWRENKKLSREKFAKAENSDIKYSVIPRQCGAAKEDKNVLTVQDNLESIEEKSVEETDQENAAVQEQNHHITAAVPSVRNSLVISENHDVSSDVTPSERSQFEPIKSIKRRRPKPDSTEESAVSSTTPEEDSSKAPPSQKVSQKDTEKADGHDLNREDAVSSTPPKEPSGVPAGSKPSRGDCDGNTSEDELTLDKRLKRKSGVQSPRKKIRINVKSLISTAKRS